MSFDPVFFNSPAYETANDAVVFCMKYFEHGDNADLITEIAQACPVTGDQMALFARDVLRRVEPRVRGTSAQSYIRLALSTLDQALANEQAPRSAA